MIIRAGAESLYSWKTIQPPRAAWEKQYCRESRPHLHGPCGQHAKGKQDGSEEDRREAGREKWTASRARERREEGSCRAVKNSVNGQRNGACRE